MVFEDTITLPPGGMGIYHYSRGFNSTSLMEEEEEGVNSDRLE
jgi:hypothetical protein